MRVIAGEKGGRRLVAPTGRGTRPTSDRVREATFSMLESTRALAGAKVWDLFAGSGALGIEALSRGAARATFVDQARIAVSAARSNLAKLGYGPDRARVVCGDALGWAQARGLEHSWGEADAGEKLEEVDLVLADPPYAWQEWSALLNELARYSPLVVLETRAEPQLPPAWQALRAKRYGGTLVTLACLRDRGEV
ncbi:MAG: RsmD family RNA methyltransferase [Acidimicrobiales bacterium]